MREDELYKKLKERMYAVSSVPPQNVGVFTPVWRKVIPKVKQSPIRVLVAGGLLSTFVAWMLLGTLLVKIVTLLQYGF